MIGLRKNGPQVKKRETRKAEKHKKQRKSEKPEKKVIIICLE